MNKRNVLCHYHIFKNAGTSFEKVLTDNFGRNHISFDGPFPYSRIDQEQLGIIIDRHPNAMACSSHQIHLPAPSSVSFRPIPVVFIRHPLLRIRSVYLFSQRDQRLLCSKHMDQSLAGFEEWIISLLSGHSNMLQINNLQTSMLCRGYNLPPRRENRGGRVVYDLQMAINNLSLVPCLGRTENFHQDVTSFIATLENYGFRFNYSKKTAENISARDYDHPIAKQIEALRSAVSEKTWRKLQWLNHQDLELYEVAHEMIETRLRDGFRIPLAKET